MAKKRGRKSKRQYFTEDTELAIIEYLASEDQVLRNKIYNERIHHSFYKLAENLIHTFKFYYTEVEDLEDLKHEVICAKKKGKADLIEVDTDNEILNGFERKEVHDVKVEFLDMYIDHVDANLSRYFKKQDEIKVADAVLTVLKNREHLEIFNKKAIYIYIREITGLETPIITKVVKKLKNIFNTTYSRYLEGPSYL